MKIALVTPTAPAKRTGNRVTAARWRRLLTALGHRCRVITEDDGRPTDVLFALHAHRSAEAAASYRARCPEGRLVVALTGTDLYRDLPGSTAARATLDAADAIIALQPRALSRLEPRWRPKTHVVFQSVPPVAKPPPVKRWFDVCVLGHLRDEKDPLRPALAARRLPASSRIRVLQLGAALTPGWAKRAEEEMAVNPRYRWLGERSGAEARRLLARSRVMVLPSRMEGGANVIGEAVVAGTAILASRIDGTLGLLGDDHPGLYPVGETAALAALLERAETQPTFLATLEAAGARVAPLFDPARERRALAAVVSGSSPEGLHGV